MLRQAREAIFYMHEYAGRIFVVKIDSDVIASAEELGIIKDIALLRASGSIGVNIVLVHTAKDLDASRQFFSLSGKLKECGSHDMAVIRDSMRRGVTPVVQCSKDEFSDDFAATRLSESINADKLIFVTTSDGVHDENRKLVKEMTVSQAKEIMESDILTGDILEKVRCAVYACESGVERVHIISGFKEDAILAELLSSEGIGTMIYRGSSIYHQKRKARAGDGPIIFDILSSSDFIEEVNYMDIIRKTKSFYVFVSDNQIHACMMLTEHDSALALEVSHLAVSKAYEDSSVTEEMLKHAIRVGRRKGMTTFFMDLNKSLVWLGIFPWFLKLGFGRCELGEMYPKVFPASRHLRIWYKSLS